LKGRLVIGLRTLDHVSRRGRFDRSDQINQNSRGSTALPGVRV
jgi:hypothetical protein